jgi:hypothetical protein
MEYLFDYKGVKIYKDIETGFFKTSLIGIDVSCLKVLKKLIDIKK